MSEFTIESQQEFVKWLKDNELYNPMSPEGNMCDMHRVWEKLNKELRIYKPSSPLQEYVELNYLSYLTPKQINGVLHKLHNETEELKREAEIKKAAIELQNKSMEVMFREIEELKEYKFKYEGLCK